MAASATAKSKLSIGTTLATTDAASFATDTFVQVKNVNDMGSFGSSSEEIVGKFVDQAYARKFKGTRDNGSMEIIVATTVEDPGQIALKAAEKTEFAYNFKVELNDKPPGGTSTIYYFKALVMSAKHELGEADNIVKTTYTLSITGEMFEIPAAED